MARTGETVAQELERLRRETVICRVALRLSLPILSETRKHLRETVASLPLAERGDARLQGGIDELDEAIVACCEALGEG